MTFQEVEFWHLETIRHDFLSAVCFNESKTTYDIYKFLHSKYRYINGFTINKIISECKNRGDVYLKDGVHFPSYRTEMMMEPYRPRKPTPEKGLSGDDDWMKAAGIG